MRKKLTYYLAISIALLCAGVSLVFVARQSKSPREVADRIAERVERQLRRGEAELEKVVSASPSEFTSLETRFPFYIYKNKRLIFWSDNAFVPANTWIADTNRIKVIALGSESWLAVRRTKGDMDALVAIPLQKKFPIRNEYLQPYWNEQIFQSVDFTILENSSSLGVPVCVNNQCYFRISFLPESLTGDATLLTIGSLLIFFGIAFLAVAAFSFAQNYQWRYAEFGLLFLFAVFRLIRAAMNVFDFPSGFIQGPLFEPQVFASSSLNRSLFDLLVNMLFLLLISFAVFQRIYRFRLLHLRNHPVYGMPVLTVFVLVILLAGLFPVVVIQTIFNNSEINLDIARTIDFNSVRLVAFLIVVMSCASTFLFSHGFIHVLLKAGKRVWIPSTIGVLIFVFVNEWTGQIYLPSLIATGLYLVTVFWFRFSSALQRLSFSSFGYLFTAVFFFALQCGYAVQYFSHREKLENNFAFASDFLVDRDVFAEYLLHETSDRISHDAFIQARISGPFLGKESIRQKIRQVYLPNYFNKYDVDIVIFNSVGDNVEGTEGFTLSSLLAAYDKDAFRTSYEGVFYLSNPERDVAQRYLVVVPVKRDQMISGHIIIELSLKKILPESVYPELLVDNSFQESYKTGDLSYAVYMNGTLATSSGDFNYLRLKDDFLGNPDLYDDGISAMGFDHIAVEDDASRLAVVSVRTPSLLFRIANFSFFLTVGLLFILILIFLQGFFLFLTGSRLFFAARIQLYLNLAFFIPLFAVSAFTLRLTSFRSQQNLDQEYINKTRTFSEQLMETLNSEREVYLDDRVKDLAKLFKLDANVYRADGLIEATSQPEIFESNLLSGYIDPKSYNRILSGESVFIESERVGSLDFFVAYAALRSSETGRLRGVLGIPFFQSRYVLDQMQTEVFVNMLNVFAIILIALLTLSYFVGKWLTFPLKFITNSLKKTSLSKTNEPLRWNAEDEIGLMVKEYNSMLFKLGESKAELEKNQREKTWREMAQQVAHEIKNPLTPMKLTLQQMERSIQAGSSTPEKTKKAVESLLVQLETLNEIASSFSVFAKMPAPVMSDLNLVQVLRQAVDLHQASVPIVFRVNLKEAPVRGDGNLLGRCFSNIILNASQAARPGVAFQLNVAIEEDEHGFVVQFKDNGKGIEPDVAERIFIPHFSTKKSGSGLGLAISRQAVEQMNGKIWFETKVGLGSTFYISLPRQNVVTFPGENS